MPEIQLCKFYGLSRNSVRKALEQLHKEGLVEKRVGLGTMVPADVAVPPGDRKVLRIVVPFPAYFVDYGMHVICDAFRCKYPHVEIHILSLPTDTFIESLQHPDQIGFCPDVVLIMESLLAFTERTGMFIDLKSAVGEALDSMYPRLAQTLCHGNSNTAVPITFSPVFLAYNTDLFRTAGIPVPGSRWNVDDFTAAAEQATMTTDGRIDRFGFSLFPSLHRWLVFALQNGMRPGADDNREKIAKALTKLQDWLHRKRIATVYTDSKNLINPFIYGKAAMTLTTLFEMSTWAERGIDFTPEIAPLPFGDTQSTLLQANLLTVPSRCAEPQLSAEFVSMALDPEVQRKMCATTPFLSVMPAVNEATRSSAYLHALNVGGGLIDQSYFLHELLGDQIDHTDLMAEMGLFWLGLEDASTVAEKF